LGSITFGTTNITWAKFAGTTYSADGTTLTLTGTTFSIATGGVGTTQIAAGAVTEAKQTLANNTTANVTSSAHGYAPISPGDATKFLNGAATPAWTVPSFGIDGLTAEPLEMTDELPFYSGLTSANQKTTVQKLGGAVNPSVCEFRLSALPGTAVPTTDQTGVTTLWLTPVQDDGSSIYGGDTYPLQAAPVVASFAVAKGAANYTLAVPASPTPVAGNTLIIILISATTPGVPSGFTLVKNQGDLYFYLKAQATGSEANLTISTAGAGYYLNLTGADSWNIANTIGSLYSSGNLSGTPYTAVGFSTPPTVDWLQIVCFGAPSATPITAPGGNTDLVGQVQGSLSIDMSTGSGLTAASAPNSAGAWILLRITPPPVGRIALWDGASNGSANQWQMFRSPAVSLSLVGLSSGNVYDVFVTESGGVLSLVTEQWNSTTSRGFFFQLLDGIRVYTSQLNYRYVGSIYCNGSASTEDSKSNRLIYNYYNKRPRSLKCTFGTSTWTYSLLTWRAANGATTIGTYSVTALCGDPSDFVDLYHSCTYANSTTAIRGAVGICLNNTNANNASEWQHHMCGAAGQEGMATARYRDYPGLGWNTFQCVEISTATGTGTFNGQNGGAGTSLAQCGMSGWILG
jgi:hypothetical protein